MTLSSLKRLVVKIGSSLLVDSKGRFSQAAVDRLASDVAGMCEARHELIVVSSGAVAIGCHLLGANRERARLDELQAAAAVGQARLVQTWQKALDAHALLAAQVLVTPDDTEHRRRFLNAKSTLLRLVDKGVVPIINENDTVATDELRYGDNDRLAARVASMLMADGLVLLSDVDGLYGADPQQDGGAKLISTVTRIDDEVMAMAGGTGSRYGSGGMATKIMAAQIARRAGCATFIANGHREKPLRAIATGAPHTVFAPEVTPRAARKQWLAGMLELKGGLSIDRGAEQAILRGGSLLPVGVIAVDGEFGRGDAVAVRSCDGHELGRGLASYASDEARAIAGARSEEIVTRLGYRGRAALVHRDDLVVFEELGA